MANKTYKTVVGKSPALGVKMAASAAIMVATTKAMKCKEEVEEEDSKTMVAKLRTELDTERRSNRQQRREREAEVQRVRNEEQTKSSIALKDLSRRLLEEKQRELDRQRESMKNKHENDLGKVVKLKERNIAKLRGDLSRCQNQLEEELSKRGLSTSARASFDSERQKLLQEVRDLQLAKRQLEDRLTEAGETEKRLQQEIKRLQESCKLEVARVEREANIEVKKLLDELKTKDHMLEQMDRSIYPDRATLLKNRMERLSVEEILGISRDTYKWSNSRNISLRSSSCSGRISVNSNESSGSCVCEDPSSCSCNISSNDSCLCENIDSCCTFNSSSSSNHNNRSLKRTSSARDRSSSSCSRGCRARDGTRSAPLFRSRVYHDTNNSGSNSNSCSKINSCGSDINDSSCGVSDSSCVNGSRDNDISSPVPTTTTGSSVNSVSSHTAVTTTTTTSSSRAADKTTTPGVDACAMTGGCALQTVNLQKRLHEAEKRVKLAEGLHRTVTEKNNTMSASNKQLENKIKSLSSQMNNMRNEQESNRKEIKRLNKTIVSMKCNKVSGLDSEVDTRSEVEFYQQRCAELDQVLVSLRHDCQEKDRRIGLLVKSQLKKRHKYEPKTVRFMLPEDVEDSISDITEDRSCSTSPSCSDPVQDDELLVQSMHKDYETLMDEHLKLEKFCATLVQSRSTNQNAVNQDLNVKRESLDIAIQALEEKVKLTEEREHKLKQQLQEVRDQNEEMEFRILELEEGSEKNMSASYMENDDVTLKNRQLEKDVEKLRLRLMQYERLDLTELEKDATSPCLPLPELGVTSPEDHQRLSVDNLRKLTASLSDSDEENQMAQSFSTMTSGFDEISCISLELDDRTEMPDMPAEEEADLERDADDIEPEMPTEECDDMGRLTGEELGVVTGEELGVVTGEELGVVTGEELGVVAEAGSLDGQLGEVLVSGVKEQLSGAELCDDIVKDVKNVKDVKDFGNNSDKILLQNHDRESTGTKTADSKVVEHHGDGVSEVSAMILAVDHPDSPNAAQIAGSTESFQSVSENFDTNQTQEIVNDVAEVAVGMCDSELMDIPTPEVPFSLPDVCDTCCKVKRLKDLQDQISILEHVDKKYSATIQTLNEIENQLTVIIPAGTIVSENNSYHTSDQPKTVDVFWTTACDEIENTLLTVEREMKEFGQPKDWEVDWDVDWDVDCDDVNEGKYVMAAAMEHCIVTLRDTSRVLQQDNTVCQELDRRIDDLEQQQSQDQSLADFESSFKVDQHPFECLPLPLTPSYPTESNESSVLGSLKRLALDVVAAGFRADLLELKSLTHDFFTATGDDELNDIAFIDEDDAGCVSSDASSAAELEGATRLQQRNELRLNTKMSAINQRFDFLSPTSFDNPEWSNSSQLETVNHYLFQQIEELERERDSLKDIVYRDDGVINDMTQQISRLENSEQELKKIVCRLEAADDQAGELVCKLESQCHELGAKLSRAESIEGSLKAELEARGRDEAEMEAKLLRSVESLEQTTTKLRGNLNEAEKDKMAAVRHTEELNALVSCLQNKEVTMLQRIKSLESLKENFQRKSSDLETSLTSAYDEVSGLTRQKEGLTQRLNSLVDDITDLREENDELTVEKKNLAAEVERLSESENFLKEANRKMWLSLQANIQEREAELSGSCTHCNKELGGATVEKEGRLDCEDPQQTRESTGCLRVSATQAERAVQCSDCSLNTSIQFSAITGLKDLVALLILSPRTILALISSVANQLTHSKHDRIGFSEACSQGSLETERKARVEEMLKFVSSKRFRLAANELQVPTNGSPDSKDTKAGDGSSVEHPEVDVADMDPVEGEDEFWSVVEKYDDIYDVRASDTWNLWRHLEQDIMGLNLEQLRRLLEESEKLQEKSCQTLESSKPSSSQHTPQYENVACVLDDDHDKMEVERDVRELPPLPATLPPVEEDESADERIYSVISCSENFTQTESDRGDQPVDSGVKSSEDILALRHLLNQNERTLNAQKNEVDRLTLEMRSWQQRALAASDQVSRLTTELSTAQQLVESTTGSSLPEYTSSIIDNKAQHVARRSRVELPSSQIPVSVKRAVDFYSSISQRSGSTSPSPTVTSPRTPSLIPRLAPGVMAARQEGSQTPETPQGPLSNGSSSSTSEKQLPPSHIPRLLPDWIQQQQQMYQGQQQQCDDGVLDRSVDDGDQLTADSSSSLQQLPAAAATTSSSAAAAAEIETEMPGLPSDDAEEEGGF